MEMRRRTIWTLWLKTCLAVLLLCYAQQSNAQEAVRSYSIKNGRMYITLGKNITTNALDSFVIKYELADLDLKTFIKTNSPDSLRKLGWKIDISNKEIMVISKPLFSADNINNPADKIIIAQKAGTDMQSVLNSVRFGANRLLNGKNFAVNGEEVRFFMRGQLNAGRVRLAGSFTDWQNAALPMTKTDSGWIVTVKLPAGKHLYKFILDDNNWRIDKDNALVENDGMGNDNSVYFKTNYTFNLKGYDNTKRVYLAGSFNNWSERDLLMQHTAGGWTLPVYLAQGTYTYRFIADGNWFADPANTDKLPNEFNDFNSVVRMGAPYIFKLQGYANAKKVVLLGSFNNWKDNELFMNKTATGWELPYALGPGNYEYRLKIDGKTIADSVTKDNIALVIDPNFTFRLKGYANAKVVCLAGDNINNWNPASYRMHHQGDEWVIQVHVDKGKYRYKFVVDGKWIRDSANKLWEQNDENTGNSVLWINEPQ
ncbi:hypothetical protein [Ferruginibacter sp.]